MANKHLYKYTDENYLTRASLRQAMGTSLIENFWREILDYRAEHQEKVPLIGMNRANFRLTKTEATSAKFSFFESKLATYSDQIADLSLNPSAEKAFEKENLLQILAEAGKLLSSPINDLTLKAMVNGFFKEGADEKEATVYRYLQILKSDPKEPDEDGLGELRFALLGHDDVSSFYRNCDFRSIYTTEIVGRNYTYAPYGEIEAMMEKLFAFLSSSCAAGLKAILSLYYISIVKPFAENNELIACAFARAVLAKEGIEGAAYLPFETCIAECQKLKDVLMETQNQNDLTYFAFYCIDKLNAFFEKSSARLAELKAETVGKEFVEIPKTEQEKAYDEIASSSIKEENPPVPEAPPETEAKPSKVPLLSEEERKAFLEGKGKNAVSSPGSSLSDKEVKETARYLLETNPLLKKKQALFYASHCTLGRFYTIQDFKKATRCVYETARTSMDGLAELGFYEKKQIKNKYVYTPLQQGESK